MTTEQNNPLRLLSLFGQSFWLDQISRSMIRSGQLRRLRVQDGLRGVTSNPSIFEKAISASTDYDTQILEAASAGATVEAIYEALAIQDICEACDELRPVFDESGGRDGFVSLEVSPLLAHSTEETLQDVRRLTREVDRPNLLIKVPATPEGLPAIEEALYEGYSINVTLIFSIDVYEQVAERYLRALERRVNSRKPVDRIASVASFFVSRIDVLVDSILEHKARSGGLDEETLRRLRGRAAIACARLVYDRFLTIFRTERFRALEAKGAAVQRPLWGSTSTKNPQYRDVMYVEPLIVPDTVNTLPLETAEAFRDHGIARATITENLDQARRTLEDLAAVGIDMNQVTDRLLREGVQKFVEPYQKLLANIEKRSRALTSR